MVDPIFDQIDVRVLVQRRSWKSFMKVSYFEKKLRHKAHQFLLENHNGKKVTYF